MVIRPSYAVLRPNTRKIPRDKVCHVFSILGVYPVFGSEGLARVITCFEVRHPEYRKTPDGPETRPDGRVRRSAPDTGRRTIIAGTLWTRWANPGGDPSTKRPTRPPNSRDGATRDAAFRTNTSRRWATLCVSDSVFYLCSD